MNSLAQYKDLVAGHQHDFKNLLPLYHEFKYDGLTFECQLLNCTENDGYIINLTALLGYLPYSAENNDKRKSILKNLRPLMAQGNVIIDHHCKLTLPLKTLFKGDLNAKILMENILFTLLDVQGTIDVIKVALDIKNSKK